jgi:hypothetical protein
MHVRSAFYFSAPKGNDDTLKGKSAAEFYRHVPAFLLERTAMLFLARL